MLARLENNFFLDQVKAHNPEILPVLDLAFRYNGFVAGGCPRALLRGEGIQHDFMVKSQDIDLFFVTKFDYENFLVDLKAVFHAHVYASPGGKSTDFSLDLANKWYKFQAIGCHFGTVNEILNTFDFVNVRLAFDGNSSWKDIRVDSLEERELLQVNCWASPLLLSRVGKYVRLHGYLGIVDEQREPFINWIYDTCVSLPDDGTIPGFNSMNKKTFRSHLGAIIRKENIVTNADLLLFFGLFGDELTKMTHSYASAFSEIWRRIEEEKRKNVPPLIVSFNDDSWY